MTQASSSAKRSLARQPAANCPKCGARAKVRSSQELSPYVRRLWYYCTNFECGKRWKATMEFEEFLPDQDAEPVARPSAVKVTKPPGAEYGQVPLLEPPAAARKAG